MFSHINISQSAADLIYSASNIALIVGAALVFFGTLGAILSGSIRERYADERITANEAKTARAGADAAAAGAAGELAKADAAKANQAAAAAIERAALLQKQADEARLEQERLKAILAWRSLSPKTTTQLHEILKLNPGSITIAFTANDPESLGLAIQFANIFAAAGWRANTESRSYPDRIFWDIFVPDGASPRIDLVRKAFQKTSIVFHVDPVPIPPIAMNVMSSSDVLVMVGSKRPYTP